jgi:peptidoglycan/xylan/chitin deacetylase (PgdA/CDA1 family)
MDYRLEGLLEKTAYKIVGTEPVLARLRHTRLHKKAVVLRYHELSHDDEDIEAWTVVRKSDFVSQMEYLADHFHVLSLDEAFFRVYHPDTIDDRKPIAVVTFDDGYRGNRTILLPIIEAMRLPVTIFVATQSVQDQTLYWDALLVNALQQPDHVTIDLRDCALGHYEIHQVTGPRKWEEMDRLLTDLKNLQPSVRHTVMHKLLSRPDFQCHGDYAAFAPLSLTELKELAACPLISLEAHSHCHNILTQLSEAEISDSIATSKALLESWTGRPVNYFAYPNGDYDTRIVHLVQHLGFKGSVITSARPWGGSQSPQMIPRVGIGRHDSFENFKIKVSSGGIRALLHS